MISSGGWFPNVSSPPTPGELWCIEVGSRAALRTETMQRDIRWFRGLFGLR